MNAGDYQKLKDIFQSAVEMPPDERPAYLDEKCNGNGALRREVERLLNSIDDEFLEKPAVEPITGDAHATRSRSGQRIGHYEVVRRIGAGGMGDVYLAVDGKLGRQVAVKILPDDFTADENRLDRFRLEARAASSLSHPNILTIFEVGEWEGTHYIATEFVDGETLRHRLSRGRLSIAEAMDLGIQLALGITAAHDASICHRDIKPENIMIRRDGLLKVVDFGLAKLVASPFRPSMSPALNDGPTMKMVNTEPGVIMGTVQYMSPEQTRGLATDERSDIWSVGCVLYEMLTGHAPFKGDTSADMVAEIVKSHPELPSRVVSDIPERLDEIIGKSLEKDPDERYQKAKELLTDLKLLKRSLELEDVLERSQPRITTESEGTVISGTNIISTRKGPKDLTEVNSAQYLYWGMKAHRLTAIGITLFIIGLVGGTALLVRYFWKESDPGERRLTYATKIKLAAQAIEASNLDYAKQLLDEARPGSGQEDLRSFEWGYLANLLAEREASKPMTIEQAGAQAVAFSADGRSVATAGFDGTVRIWDTATGEEIHRLLGHTNGWVWHVAFAKDQNVLVSQGSDNVIKVWNSAAGKETFTIGSETDPAITPVLAPDGRSFAAIQGDRIRFWDIATGAELGGTRTRTGNKIFAYSPNGRFLCVSGTELFTTLIIDREQDRVVSTLKGHAGFWTDAEFTPDSQQIVTGNTDGTVKLWDVQTGRDLRTYRDFPGEIYELALSPDGKTLAAAGKASSITLWDRETGYEVATLRAHTGNVDAIAFSTDGQKLASSGDNTTRIWNVPTSQLRGVLRGHSSVVKSIAFSRDSKLIASASDDSARIWDVATEQQKLPIPGPPEGFNSVDFSPEGRTLLTGAQDGQVTLWDAVTGRALRKFDSLSKGTEAFFSPDGATIATSHFFNNPDVRIWEAASGKLRCSFRPNESEDESVYRVSFARAGKTIAPFANKVIGLWNITTCEEVWKFEGVTNQFFAVIFAPGDRLIGIEPLNNTRSLRLFDPKTGAEITSIRGHDAAITSLDLSPDGKRLATGSSDGSIFIWDVVTGQEVLSLKAGPAADFQAAFSPDGKILATSGKDSTIRLWRAADLNE